MWPWMCYRHTANGSRSIPMPKTFTFAARARALGARPHRGVHRAESQELIKPSKTSRGGRALAGAVTARLKAMLLLAQAYRQKGDPDYVYATPRKVPETLRKLRSTGGSTDAEGQADEDAGSCRLVRKLHRLRRDLIDIERGARWCSEDEVVA